MTRGYVIIALAALVAIAAAIAAVTVWTVSDAGQRSSRTSDATPQAVLRQQLEWMRSRRLEQKDYKRWPWRAPNQQSEPRPSD